MRVSIITYDCRHLKTEQVLYGLQHDKELELSIYALPFVDRPARDTLFSHRPDMKIGTHPENLAEFYNIPYAKIDGVADITDPGDACVILGAGLLPGEFVERVRTVNCHPGLIPAVRGLDAFKWAIHDSQPLGNTLHLIDAEVDAGEHLCCVRTPVLKGDTLEDLARRHYEMEIAMMANFRKYLLSPEPEPKNIEERPARRRMPAETEHEMLERAARYIATHCKDSV